MTDAAPQPDLLEHPIARWLLGGGLHPGGEDLTRRLADLMEIGPGDLVVDVAAGRGASVVLLARERGCRAIGVEARPDRLQDARRAVADAGLGEAVRLVAGPPDALPVDSGVAAGAICERGLSELADRPAAVAEMARVVAPGGRVGISDLTAEVDRLDQDLRDWVGRIADARPLAEYARLLEDAGLRVRTTEPHPKALDDLLGRLESRLGVAGVVARVMPRRVRSGATGGLDQLRRARAAIGEGTLGYAVLVAERPR